MLNMKRTNKSRLIGIRFTPEQAKQIEQRARARGMTLTEHLRDLARRDLEQSDRKAAA
jgi:hypothetical protein